MNVIQRCVESTFLFRSAFNFVVALAVTVATPLTALSWNERQKPAATNQIRTGKPVRAYGDIRFVDAVRRIAWINLGSEDHVRRGLLLDVYKVGPEKDVKTIRDVTNTRGKVEVVRILAAHLSEVRILKFDIKQPIAKTDLVYDANGLGLAEKFASVGLVDFDRDAKSDRQLLHDIIKSHGGTLVLEVDDEGRQSNKTLPADTRFLIVGEIPEPEAVKTPSDRVRATRIAARYKQLKKEAVKHGIRIVTLADFLKLAH